jgi:hypothetical protein
LASLNTQICLTSDTDGDDYDDDDDNADSGSQSTPTKSGSEKSDRQLMPPPTWIPTSSGAVTTQGAAPSTLSPSKPKLTTPLASMMPPELADKDVHELFPEFREGQVSYWAIKLQLKLQFCYAAKWIVLVVKFHV